MNEFFVSNTIVKISAAGFWMVGFLVVFCFMCVLTITSFRAMQDSRNRFRNLVDIEIKRRLSLYLTAMTKWYPEDKLIDAVTFHLRQGVIDEQDNIKDFQEHLKHVFCSIDDNLK